jgi:hypothetical protein
MKYFTVDKSTGSLDFSDSRILLIKEFKALLDNTRNKSKSDPEGEIKERAQKEFTFMFLYLDWESPYFKYPEEDRQQASFDDSGLTEEQMNDPEFIEACKKYNELQDKIQELRLLKGCMLTIESIIYYLEHIDVNERNPSDGKPIYKTKDVIMEIKNARELIKTVRDLEKEVKEGVSDESSVRGGVELGYFD